MVDKMGFQFEMAASVAVQPILRIKTINENVYTLAVVEEDIAAALIQLGDREYLGPVTIRLKQPLFGQDKFAGCRMDNLLVEAEPRTVSLYMIFDEPRVFTLDRQKFCRYLRDAMKELARVREKGTK